MEGVIAPALIRDQITETDHKLHIFEWLCGQH